MERGINLIKQRLPPRVPSVLLLLLSLLVPGCGLWDITPGKGDIERVKKAGRITAVTYAPSRFTAEYPGFEQERFNKGLYGTDIETWKQLFEFGSLVKEGERLIRDFGLGDPAIRVRDGLAGYLEKDLGFPPIIREKEALRDDGAASLRERLGAGTILDFMTISWKLYQYPSDPQHYRVSLKVRGRLIDLRDSKVLWRATCSFTTGENPAESPTFQELTANGGEWLRQLLTGAADHCAGEFEAKFQAFKQT